MNKIFIIGTVAVFIATVFFSCTGTSEFKTAENGTVYKVHYRGNDTTLAKMNEIVEVQMQYRVNDSIIFNSLDTDDGSMHFPITKPIFKGDLYDALTLMGTGDSITVEVVADSFYLKTAALQQLPESILPGSKLYYDIKLIEHLTTEQWNIEMEKRRSKQRRDEKIALQQYINENNIKTKPTNKGLYFIEQQKGRGPLPDTGDMCQVYLSVKVLGENELLYTNYGERPLDIEYGGSFDTEGFRLGLGMLRPGGKATLLVPSWIGVGTTGREIVDPYTTLIYEVELLAIRSLEDVKKDREEYRKEQEAEKQALKKSEPKRIADYLKKNNLSISPTESGLYFKDIKVGKGDYPVDGNSVTIEYIHYDLDGNILQSSYEDKTPFTYIVGTGAVIDGWEESVKKMKKGGKSWMLIPSNIGYGEQQRTKDIKPYTPLIFELELIEIRK